MDTNATSKKGNTSLIYIVIALVLVAGGFLWYSNQNRTIAPTTDDLDKVESLTEDKNEDDEDNDDENDATETDVKVVTVKGSPFKFDVTEIKVKVGEKVRIKFESTQGTHDWVVDEFNARTKVVNTGETDSVVFVADKAGTFEYYCSVGNHRAQGMVGNLIVE